MKKKLAILLMACMTVGLMACGTAKDETVEGTEAVTANANEKTFTIGFDPEFPPFGYRDDNGDYIGFDIDLAQEVCNRKGWTLVKQPIDWDSKDMELSSGSIDCIWNGFTMTGREEDYSFTSPYVDNSQVFVVAEDAGIQSQADLAGKIIGVQKDSAALAALEDTENQKNLDLAKSFKDLVQYADYNTGFMDLESGAIDALAVDVGVAAYQISQREGGYVILDEELALEQYGIGFLKGNDSLRDEVEATLQEMAKDGTVAKIAEKYSDFGLVDSVCLGK